MGLLQKHRNLEWVFDRMVLVSYAVQECKKLQQTTGGWGFCTDVLVLLSTDPKFGLIII